MLALLLLLPCAASAYLKAIGFGHIAPAETLVSFPAPSAISTSPENLTQEQNRISYQPTLKDQTADDVQLLIDVEFEVQDDAEHDYDEFGHYLPVGTTGDTTLVRRTAILEKRAAFRGTMQIDCLEAPEVCQNAGWYQNCMMGAQGSTTAVTYQEGGGVKKRDDANRLQSGVTVSRGTPCATWPFGQKFWDPYPFNPNPTKPSESYLETDEWPMASFENPAFDPTANPPQHALRCITGWSNKGGARAWTNFRRGHGPYQTGNKWEAFRLGTKSPFVRGDSFNVQFNFDSFDANNADHQRVRKSVRSHYILEYLN